MANLDTKKNGRFIKKSDPLHKVLTISDFSLADICETPSALHDNANANIIHEKLHLKEELSQSVRPSYEMDTAFPDHEERMIIRPLDFTEEWNRMRSRQSSRHHRNDEDDDFDLEAARAEEASKAQDEADDLAREREEREDKDLVAVQTSQPPATPIELVRPQPPILETRPAPLPLEAAPTPVPAPPPPMVPTDEFVPYNNPKGVPESFTRPEQPISEEELEAIRQEAREEGYRQGYQSGEERATLESRNKVQAILGEVSNIVGELEGMQKSILNQAQTNFHAICKTFIESMLHREFAMEPDAFGLVLERAISEGLNEDEFKIFVSPKVGKELRTWSNELLKSRIRTDDSIKDYNFRIEGQHASVDANLTQLINDLLDQADLSLFDSKDKAG